MAGVDHADEDVRWLGEDQRPALADFWHVYEAQFDEVHARARAWARQHPELGPLMRPLPVAQLLEAGPQLREIMRRAVARDPASYRAELGQAGAAFAEAGVSLTAACEAGRFGPRLILRQLIERYATDPARLAAAIQAMNDFVTFTTVTIANAYLQHTQARMRAREVDLATTLDSIGDAVIVTDIDARIVRMNPVAEQLTGFPLAECLGKQLEDAFRIENEYTGETVESPVLRVLREGVVVGLANHTQLVARDGTRRPIADSGAPVRSETGAVRGVVLVFRDITEERRTEDALRHWERIFQHANWGVALASVDDVKFRAVNPEYARMHGYTVEELLGAPVSLLWTPDTRADMERHARETHEHGHLVAETTHRRKDGSTLPVEIVATTIKDAQGKVAWFVANVQDISERKRLQELRVRAIELEAQNRRIEEANRLKSEFLANMSHELRTPLNSIIGFSELIHDERVGPIGPQQKEFLRDILSGGRHLLRLINDVLDLAKVEAGKMEFRAEPADLPLLVDSVVQGLRATAFEKRLQIEVSVDPALENVILDPARFKQILYNYVSNALKFTPDGGRVSVRVEPDGADHFRVEVEDDGVGISPEDVSRLFVEFQQLDSSNAKRHGGTGLGLALTKRLAEAQGGTVGVRPADVQGSVFFAVLPRRPAGFTDPLPRRDYTRLGSSILVVEDDAADRAVLVRTLRGAGYGVDAVSNCAEAAAAWQKGTYDAITLDLLLPDSECLQDLLRLVRDAGATAKVPVIAITVVADGSAVAGFEVTDVLTKPIESTKLLQALERGGVLPTRGRPVLVVDDDAGSLKLMEATLASLGHDALCCSDAREALRALQHVRPVAVIIDLIMPEMDGFAFLERFRALPENDRIPAMVWTIKDLSADERRGLERAASAVVQKGVEDGSRLSVALRALLSSRDSTEEHEP